MKHLVTTGLIFATSLACLSFSASAETGAFPAKPKPAAQPKVSTAAEPFDLSEVKLLPSPFKQAQDLDHSYLLRVDPDRLIAFFQRQAGLLKGDLYLGWKAVGLGGGGARTNLGHYLTACAKMYQVTGDPILLERVNHVVEELAKCQQVEGNQGLLTSGGEKKGYAELAAGNMQVQGAALNGVFVAFYSMHKVFAGLIDAYTLCGNQKALEVLLAMTDWCDNVTKKLNEEQLEKMLTVEHGGMAESLANVYWITGQPNHLALAKKFRQKALFDPILSGSDCLTGLHANTQIPKFVGYQRIHELTGDADYGKAAANFWTFVAQNRSFAIGGNSLHEAFHAVDKFEDAMHVVGGPETCNTYNMLKLTRALFAEKPDVALMDFHERGLYNQILPSQNPRGGGFTYYQALVPGGFRTYSDLDHSWWCCVGTGMENHGLYGAAIYSHKADRLWVNLFIPSELNWRDQGVSITQSTAFPDESRTSLQVQTKAPKKFTMAIRYPRWVAAGALKLSVNGQPVETKAQPGSYAEVTRTWKSGDTLSVELPMEIRAEMLPNSTSYAALFYGPILLSPKLGREGLVDEDFRGPHNTIMPAKYKLSREQIPVMVVPVNEVASHLERVANQPLQFKSKGLFKPADLTLVPYNRIFDERYEVYFPLASLASYEEDKKRWAAEEKAEREREALTTDEVRCGEQQPEIDHQVKGEKSEPGKIHPAVGRAFRESKGGGWFSYEMRVDSNTPMQLLCTYWGSDKEPRCWDVLVEGQVVGTEEPNGEPRGRFVEKLYSIPAELTQGKTKVTVKFQAQKNRMAGGVYNCRMLKAKAQ